MGKYKHCVLLVFLSEVMVNELRSILQRYWGHAEFRDLQEDIIRSVLEGHDTLALLPTGGGKSVCFQVPALARKGMCLVVSPLIALMRDQVRNLNARGIKAIAITSAMEYREIDIALDNCIYGEVKFLYVSPERLQTALFQERLKRMSINLIAVDEAHCISQWGYDFRPPYLRIAEIRQFLPDVPVMALTATATPEVVEDIQEKLAFHRGKVFRSSFARKNLGYIVRNEENKGDRMLRICNQIQGTGIIYVRNRKRTQETALFLQKNGISADFYHAGLEPAQREQKQNDWISGKTRVICSTNAFGMGIDKPDVRFVIHLDLPDSPEAYFQEAGRGGRDGQMSWAIMLYDEADVFALEESVRQSFPDMDTVRRTYIALHNYYQIAIGAGLEKTAEFDLNEFCHRFNLIPTVAHNAMRLLEIGEFIELSEAYSNPARIRMLMDQAHIYDFQIRNKNFDAFIKLLLRSYSGLFDDFVRINEKEIAKRTGMEYEQVVRMLKKLDELKVIVYVPRSDKPRITFLQNRMSERDFSLPPVVYEQRKRVAMDRMHTMTDYVRNKKSCRSTLLLKYFGEDPETRCGLCDHCQRENKVGLSNIEMESITVEIKEVVSDGAIDIRKLREKLGHHSEEKIKKVIRWLLDNDQLKMDEENRLEWK
ncbi:MAG TPA: ATP-dependent DNA helicase RecQ [Flavobacteriales bacterium]|nr:ATP-dependent DNA helicase RecQ [Flavobacteriales bacterium]HRJ39956.1 ATP-dependent DNA helicase RecQ [Flavobacteriales bacterium]